MTLAFAHAILRGLTSNDAHDGVTMIARLLFAVLLAFAAPALAEDAPAAGPAKAPPMAELMRLRPMSMPGRACWRARRRRNG
ncbi:hypothetical protein AUC69_00980 [Methyloceanibacter superfactus]|uniref:Uncharacterized protein n=1 Tax=Methyloceanibacter superfactus TaxID=1774969 RepID=A0A1E3W3T0_9HYPH|nr:hypothetical protein AUC69_00980 [Methyloceanibacter superfactus]